MRISCTGRWTVGRASATIAMAFGTLAGGVAWAVNPGDLDASFGTGGKVLTNVANTDTSAYFDKAEGVALQADGKIVVTGQGGNGSTADTETMDLLVARYNPDGTLDATFGTGGIVLTSFTAGNDSGRAVAIQPDGKIVVAGATDLVNNHTGTDFALARYNTDGSLDSSFGTGGKVVTNISGIDLALAVLLQPDGKIVAGGSAQGVGSPGNGVVAVRYNSDGTLDTTFGTAGKFTASGTLSTLNAPRGWALQADGKIVIGGSASGDWAVGRLTGSGAIDATFGTGGITVTNLGGADDRAWVLRVQPDGMILGAGTGAGIFALARYTSGGVLDAGFGTGGIVTTAFPGTSGARALRVLADGKILAAGFSGPVFTPDFALARYTTSGVADATFGAGGQVTTNFGCNDTAFDLVQQPDAMVVAVGYGFAACGGPNQAIALARYLTFTCGNATIEAGEQCDDGNTASGDCCDASCQAETGNACTDDGNACTNDQCNASGVCAHPSNSAPCNDGVFCNGADTCSGGTCAQHAGDPCATGPECAASCNEATDDCFDPGGTPCTDDGNVCTADTCNGSGACAHPANALPCDDGLFCNGADTCSGGSCGHAGDPCTAGSECADACNEAADNCFDLAGTPCTSDGNVCTTDQCNGGGACAHPNNTAPCNDGLFCNGADTCSGGACAQHAGDPCATGPECADTCNEGADDCNDPSGTACSSDGDPCTVDACTGAGTCAHPAGNDGASCDDANACSTGDTCSGGVCIGGTTVVCALCETCDSAGGCILAPRPGCKDTTRPSKAQLLLQDRTPDDLDQVKWKWSTGQATTFAELGMPLATDDYALCVYDAGGFLFRMTAPAGGTCGTKPCWKQLGSATLPKGYTYKDTDGLPNDLDGLTLKAGAEGKAKMSLKGKGPNIPMPALGGFSLPLTTQLQRENGQCWEATFSSTGVMVDTNALFKAKSD